MKIKIQTKEEERFRKKVTGKVGKMEGLVFKEQPKHRRMYQQIKKFYIVVLQTLNS